MSKKTESDNTKDTPSASSQNCSTEISNLVLEPQGTPEEPSPQNVASDLERNLHDLCFELTRPSSSFDCEGWLNRLELFSNGTHRLMYSQITSFVYGIVQNNDEAESKDGIFFTNLGKVRDYILAYPDKFSASQVRTTLKFYDHAELAHLQVQTIRTRDSNIENLVEQKVENKVTLELSKTTERMSSQLVGLVAIFTALSFVLFGGISALDSVFSYLGEVTSTDPRWFSILPPLIVALLWGFCMLNLLFAFMYFVLRVTDRTFGSRVGDPYAQELSGWQRLKNTFRRFPLVVFADYSMVALILLLAYGYIIAVSDTGNAFLSSIMGFIGVGVFWIIGVLLIILLVALGKFFWVVCFSGKKAETDGRESL